MKNKIFLLAALLSFSAGAFAEDVAVPVIGEVTEEVVNTKPKVAVFASEQNVDGVRANSFYRSYFERSSEVAVSETSFNTCENAVSNALSSAGFPIVELTLDPTEVKKAYKLKPVFERYDENFVNIPEGNAAKLAKVVDNDVGLVVTCTALAKNSGKKSAFMNSIGANVTCKAVNVKNNSRVMGASATAAVVHVDPVTGGNQALEKVCREVGDKLASALSERFK